MINPKDMIKKLSVEELCATADKYFQTISDPTPQMAKPFSSLIECPTILQDMGQLLSELHLGKTMTVLEFGAGTCWFSRYLTQLQCQTISCDTSKSALEIGKRLFKEHPIIGNLVSEPSFLYFDGRKLDLPDESVDRIICHDAFHHIPNQEEVLSELARVLKNGGIAGFCEPGRSHSQAPQSQYEMRNYNVLENDIVLSDIFDLAKTKGFTDIRCKLLSDMSISYSQYDSLVRNKPSRILKNAIGNNICNVMNSRTIFFLHKGKFVPDSRTYNYLSHSISTKSSSFFTLAGDNINLSLKIVNNGKAKWLVDNIHNIAVVMIGTHLYDMDNNLLNLDFSRHVFDKGIEPGEVLYKDISLRFNDKGKFRIEIDLVSESICWFENIGSKPAVIEVEVT